MNVIASSPIDHIRMDIIEVNNNFARKTRKGSQVSVSSVSSCQSDSSEENPSRFDGESPLQDVIDKAEDKKIRTEYRRCRSLSDGGTNKLKIDDYNSDAFPSLPNSVLERMGLRGSGLRERLSDEELEQKFSSLALAFTIDAATIKDRCERQRRSRDQTETNLATEIERLKDKLALMKPLCTDYETVELLSALLTQVDKVTNASSLVSISAERYGSVQHEERLTESVQLMISHVQMLKQQRDSTRRQLQYTKRVLQNTGEVPSGSPTTPTKPISPNNNTNKANSCRRRASIATFSQSLQEKPLVDVRKVTRRTSELSLRASSINRTVRPNRLELCGDLVKIKEGFAYHTATVEEVHNEHHEDHESEEETHLPENQSSTHSSPDEPQSPIQLTLSIREKIKYRFKKIEKDVQKRYNKWTHDGTVNEVCLFCALICFSVSLIAMVNILVEYEYAKRGWDTSPFLWFWPGSQNEGIYRSIKN